MVLFHHAAVGREQIAVHKIIMDQSDPDIEEHVGGEIDTFVRLLIFFGNLAEMKRDCGLNGNPNVFGRRR